MRPSSAEISEVSWNQVEKLAGETFCSISAKAFSQTLYIVFDLLVLISSIA